MCFLCFKFEILYTIPIIMSNLFTLVIDYKFNLFMGIGKQLIQNELLRSLWELTMY